MVTITHVTMLLPQLRQEYGECDLVVGIVSGDWLEENAIA